MKIIYIAATLPLGGPDDFFFPEAHEIINDGHDIVIIPRSSDKLPVDEEGIALLPYTIDETLVSPRVLSGAILEAINHPIKTVKTVLTLFKSRNLLTLIKNIAVLPKGLWAARLARRMKADHIHAHWASTPATIGFISALQTGIPFSFTAHRGDIVLNNLLEQKFEYSKFARFISADGIELAARITGNDLVRKKAIVEHLGVNVPNDDSIVTIRSEKEKRPGIFTFLCAANMVEIKGHKYLLKAIKILMERGLEFGVILAGYGLEVKNGRIVSLKKGGIYGNIVIEIMSLIEKYGIGDKITIIGRVPHDELMSYYKKGMIDCAVLTSLYEGIPVSLMEAMSYGVPAISTNVGGTKELLGDGAGILVEVGNCDEIATAMERVMTDGIIRETLSKTGRQRIKEQFDARITTAGLLEKMKEYV